MGNYIEQIDVLDKGFVRLLNVQSPYSYEDKADLTDVAKVARGTSFANSSERPREQDIKLLNFLAEHKHTVPFEHIEIWLEMKLPIFLARQFAKHRTTSISEMSGRYVEIPEEFYVPCPADVRLAGGSNKQGGVLASTQEDLDKCRRATVSIHAASSLAFAAYHDLIASGVSNEVARNVLPLNTYTVWTYKQDLHNLLHFLRLRLGSGAQMEAKEYAIAIRMLLVNFFGGEFLSIE